MPNLIMTGHLDYKIRIIACLCLFSGSLYAVGGHDGANYLKTVEKYNPETNQWTYVASMGARRGGVGVATLGGCLYATGGYDGTSNLSTSGKTIALPLAPQVPIYVVQPGLVYKEASSE